MDMLTLLAAEAHGGVPAVQVLLSQLFVVIVGFALFVWVLKKLAWGPIIAMLDERREAVATQFDEIDRKTEEAAALHRDYEERLRRIDEEARERMNAAIEEARRISEQLTANARREAEEIVSKARATMQMEMESARLQLKQDVVEMTLAATEKLLRANMNDDRQRQMVREFVDELSARQPVAGGSAAR